MRLHAPQILLLVASGLAFTAAFAFALDRNVVAFLSIWAALLCAFLAWWSGLDFGPDDDEELPHGPRR